MTERKTERESEVKRGCRWIQKCTARANEVAEKAGKVGVVEKLGNSTDAGKVRKRIGYVQHTHEFSRPFVLVKHKLSDKDQTGQIHDVKKAKSTSDNQSQQRIK